MSGEFKLVEAAFMGTINPSKGRGQSIFFGGPSLFRPQDYSGSKSAFFFKIIKIEKAYNCILYEKFLSEVKRFYEKNPGKSLYSFMKFLFHYSKEQPERVVHS